MVTSYVGFPSPQEKVEDAFYSWGVYMEKIIG